MKICVSFLLFTLWTLSVSAQSWNMSLCYNYDDSTLPFRGPVVYNDVWGFTTNSGKEVGIFGSVDSVYFFEVKADCYLGLRRINVFAGGTSSIWRDFKTYKNYAYAVADEGKEGLMVFDLKNAPDSINYVGRDDSIFHAAHNLFIDTAKGHLFLAGASLNNVGYNLIMYDLKSNPAAPRLIKKINLPGAYVHDLFVLNDTAYCSHGYNGFYIYVFDSLGNFSFINSITSYPQQGYNHSSWVSKNRKYLVFADETHNTSLKVYDISNILSPKLKSLFRSQLLAPKDTMSIVHNPFIKDDNIFISYYHDGIQMFNISDPVHPINVAYYDTEPMNMDYSGYQGAWGVYPFLPSGKILGSDIKNGFFVFNLDFVLAGINIEIGYQIEDNAVKINWKIAKENLLNKRIKFYLEKSFNGTDWLKIHEISNQDNFDYYLDQYISTEANYYRIVGTENLISKYYSKTVFVPPHSEINSGEFYFKGDKLFTSKDMNIEELKLYNLESKLLAQYSNPCFPINCPSINSQQILIVEIKDRESGIYRQIKLVK
ncbi:MAG: choice-of-anchor B family protein [Saprospiraceae bacterium]